ncbi:MAG: DUF2207 domain-containing protein [Clostridia bacterium]|nr:DUF2207 domain-containing protein [Clostridia bacterium]
MKALKSFKNCFVILISALALAAAVCGVVFGRGNSVSASALSAEASVDNNYNFALVDVNVDVNEDKTMRITENLYTTFASSNVNTGFIRDIQRITRIKRTVNGKIISGNDIFAPLDDIEFKLYKCDTSYGYKTAVDGVPTAADVAEFEEMPSKYTYELYQNGQFHSIKMQKQSGYLQSGMYLFQLSYTYDLSDDKAGGFDDLTLDVLGYDMRPATAVHAKVNFPKSIDRANAGVYLNNTSSFEGRALWEPDADMGDALSIKDTSVEFYACFNKGAKRSFTIQAILPDGYFTGTGLTFFWYYIPFAVIAAAAVVALLILALKMIDKKPLETVEFYPPEGMPVMRFSAIWHRGVRDKDTAALILKWAGLGLITIQQDGYRDIILRPTGKLSAKKSTRKRRKSTATNVFDEFPDRVSAEPSSGGNVTSDPFGFEEGGDNAISPADMKKYFANAAERNYYDTLFSGIGGTNMFSSRVFATQSVFSTQTNSAQRKLYTVTEALKKDGETPSPVDGKLQKVSRYVFPYLSLVPMVCAIAYQCLLTQTFVPLLFLIFMAAGSFVIPSMGGPRKAIFIAYIFPVAFFAMPYFAFIMIGTMPAYDYAKLMFIAPVIWAIGNFVLPWLKGRRTEEANKYYGQMLGFKNFLLKAELPRIQKLFDENPEYFADILPWCFIMGISDKVEKRFKSLDIKIRVPQYVTDRVNVYVMASCMHRAYYSGAPRSSGGRGGFGGGGGGFGGSSGGGGGGGGSRGC